MCYVFVVYVFVFVCDGCLCMCADVFLKSETPF